MGWLTAALLAVIGAAQEPQVPPPAESPFMELRRPLRGAGCPKGSRRVEFGGPLRFRCVMVRSGKDPTVEQRQGTGLYKPHRIGEVSLDVPVSWHLTQAWSDEVPTLYVEYDTSKPGKQVTLVVSRFEPGQPGYEPMQKAIAKEMEYQGAVETPPRRVGGLPGRHTIVAGESRAAYLAAGKDVYYVLAYSAPEKLFDVFEPSYDRLLKSFRAGAR